MGFDFEHPVSTSRNECTAKLHASLVVTTHQIRNSVLPGSDQQIASVVADQRRIWPLDEFALIVVIQAKVEPAHSEWSLGPNYERRDADTQYAQRDRRYTDEPAD